MGDDYDTTEDSLPPITSNTPTKSMFEFESLIDTVLNGTDPYTHENITLDNTTNSKESNNSALRSSMTSSQSNGHHTTTTNASNNQKPSSALKNDVKLIQFNQQYDTNCYGMQSQSQSKSSDMNSMRSMQGHSAIGQTLVLFNCFFFLLGCFWGSLSGLRSLWGPFFQFSRFFGFFKNIFLDLSRFCTFCCWSFRFSTRFFFLLNPRNCPNSNITTKKISFFFIIQFI